MIEDITTFAIGICAGLVPFLIFEIFNIYIGKSNELI